MVSKKTKKKAAPKSGKLAASMACICDTISHDAGIGKTSLYGIFDVVWCRKFPAHVHFAYYAKIMGPKGTHELTIWATRPDGKSTKCGEVEIQCDGVNPNAIHVTVQAMTLEKPGTYQFDLKQGRRRVAPVVTFRAMKQRESPARKKTRQSK